MTTTTTPDYMEQDSMEFHESDGAPTAPAKAAAK